MVMSKTTVGVCSVTSLYVVLESCFSQNHVQPLQLIYDSSNFFKKAEFSLYKSRKQLGQEPSHKTSYNVCNPGSGERTTKRPWGIPEVTIAKLRAGSDLSENLNMSG